MGGTNPLKNFLPSVEKSVEHSGKLLYISLVPLRKIFASSWYPKLVTGLLLQHRCLHEMIHGLLYCYYYKFKGPSSGSDEASKQHRSQNEVEKAMGPQNKLAKTTGGFLSIFNCCKPKDGTVGPKMPLVTDDVIDRPNKIIGCAAASECLLISVTFP